MKYLVAIGDIHGKKFCLERLVENIENKIPLFDLVLLGDYIDRGEDSKGVIDYIREREFNSKIGNTIALKGNHEQLAELSLQGNEAARPVWLGNGGVETIQSFGSEENMLPYLDWIKNLPISYTWYDKFFCHAGINQLVPLQEQRENDLLWRRDRDDVDYTDQLHLIVHGHTPRKNGIFFRGNRINLDTGAVFGKQLSAAVFTSKQKIRLHLLG